MTTTSPMDDPSHPWNRPLSEQVDWVYEVVSKAAKTEDQKNIAEILPHVLKRSDIRSRVSELRDLFMKKLRDDHIRNQRREISQLEAARRAKLKELAK